MRRTLTEDYASHSSCPRNDTAHENFGAVQTNLPPGRMLALLPPPDHCLDRGQSLHLQPGPVLELEELERQQFPSHALLHPLEMGPQAVWQLGAHVDGGGLRLFGEQIVHARGEVRF